MYENGKQLVFARRVRTCRMHLKNYNCPNSQSVTSLLFFYPTSHRIDDAVSGNRFSIEMGVPCLLQFVRRASIKSFDGGTLPALWIYLRYFTPVHAVNILNVSIKEKKYPILPAQW